MKCVVLVLAALALVLTNSGQAKAEFTISFDENGAAFVSVYQGRSYSEQGYLAPDQSGHFPSTPVLTYDLPEAVTAGGVDIRNLNGNVSDNLYFYSNESGGHMEFLSQVGGGALADTGVVTFGATGATEGADGTFTYAAGPGNPASTNFYKGISPVPEPTSLAVFGLTSLAGVAFCGWRRRRQPAQA